MSIRRGDAQSGLADANFAGFGQYLTRADGAFLSGRSKPDCNGRTRHFHVGGYVPDDDARHHANLLE